MALGRSFISVIQDGGGGTYKPKVTPSSNSTSGSSGARKSSAASAGATVDASGSGTRAYYASGGGGDDGGESESYDDRWDRIASAYDRAAELLGANYNSAVSRLNAAKKKSTKETKEDAEKSLRQAYVSNMLGRRDLNQRLAAMGYNGGAVESTMAKLANQYGNARTDIVNQRARDISVINQTYGDNLAKALQEYNTALANLEMSRLQMELSL